MRINQLLVAAATALAMSMAGSNTALAQNYSASGIGRLPSSAPAAAAAVNSAGTVVGEATEYNALGTMSPDVVWPKAFKGSTAHGHREVREYWTGYWSEVHPYVKPVSFHLEDGGRILLDVHPVV